MKKLLFVFPIVVLLAAGCNSTNNTAPNSTNQTTNTVPITTIPQNPSSTPQPTPTPPPTTASISNFAFSPAAITIKKGTKVTWTNQDNVAHTVTGDNAGPASGSLSHGSSYSFIFTQTGTFSYHCNIHPSMTATVTVTQ